MEDLAIEMDCIREELCDLLSRYEVADESEQQVIAERCEQLGGQVQDLVGMLKFSLLELRREAHDAGGEMDEHLDQVEEVTDLGLRTIHAAGQEVARAIRFLREVWDSPPLDDPP